MTTIIPVSLGARSYDVVVGTGLIDDAAAHVGPFKTSGRRVIITDANVAPIWLDRLAKGLGEEVVPIILPAGEVTKSWTQLAHVCDELLALGIERSDHVIALGGGVIGDLVGFATAILKRGCNFIQIPTSLLAQVDSSVGGKTAINATLGKNLIGAFHQPRLVLIDVNTLDTLPPREMRAGYAEIAKYGLINDPAFFDWCEANGAALLNGDRAAQLYAIGKSVAAKAAIVAADERETEDVRALLNLGHTFGHALEAETDFSSRLLHGEGVAAGIVLAHAYSARIGKCGGDDAERVRNHFASVGLPVTLGEADVTASGATLVDHMRHDKKMTGNTLPFILSKGIGQSYVDKSVDLSDVAAFLDTEGKAHRNSDSSP